MKKTKIAAILNLCEDGGNLFPLTKRRPLASLPFCCRYRLIDFPFSSLSDAEINSCALFVSGNEQSLYDHIRGGHDWGLDSIVGGGVFTHSNFMNDYLEISDYYQTQLKYVKDSKAEHIIIMGSKMLCNIDIKSILKLHIDNHADITCVYKTVSKDVLSKHSKEYFFTLNKLNITRMDNDQLKYEEDVNLSMNIAIIKRDRFIEYVQHAIKDGVKGDVNLLCNYGIESGNHVIGYAYTGYLKHIDSIQKYIEANMDMLDKNHYNALFHSHYQIITRPKHGAPTFFSDDSEVIHSQLASDCFVEGRVEHSLIFRKVMIGKNVSIKNSIIMPQCKIEDGVTLEYVILDKEVEIKSGAVLKGTKEKPLIIEKNSVIQ